MIEERSMNPPVRLAEVDGEEAVGGRSKGNGCPMVTPNSLSSSYQDLHHHYRSRQQQLLGVGMEESSCSRIQPVQVSVIDSDIQMMLVPSKSLKMSEEEERNRKKKQVLPPSKPKKVPSGKELRLTSSFTSSCEAATPPEIEEEQQPLQQRQRLQWSSSPPSCGGGCDDPAGAFATMPSACSPIAPTTTPRTSCTTTTSSSTFVTRSSLNSGSLASHDKPAGGGLTAAAAIATGMCSDLSETEADSQYESSTYRDGNDDEDDDDDDDDDFADGDEEEVDSLEPVLNSKSLKARKKTTPTTTTTSSNSATRNFPPRKPKRFVGGGNSSTSSNNNNKRSSESTTRRRSNRRCSNETKTSVSSLEVEDESTTAFSILSSDPGGGGTTSDDYDTTEGVADRNHASSHHHHCNSSDDKQPRRPLRRRDRCDTLSEDDDEDGDRDDVDSNQPACAEPNSSVGGMMTDSSYSERLVVGEDDDMHPIAPVVSQQNQLPSQYDHHKDTNGVPGMCNDNIASSPSLNTTSFDEMMNRQSHSPIVPTMQNDDGAILDDEVEDDEGYKEDDDDEDEDKQNGSPPAHYKTKTSPVSISSSTVNGSGDVYLPPIGCVNSSTNSSCNNVNISGTSNSSVAKSVPLVGLGPSKKETRWAGVINKKTTICPVGTSAPGTSHGLVYPSSSSHQSFGDRIPYSPRRRSADETMIYNSLHGDSSSITPPPRHGPNGTVPVKLSYTSSMSDINFANTAACSKPTSASGDTLPTAPRRASYDMCLQETHRRPSCDTLPILPLRQLEELELDDASFSEDDV